MKKVVFVSGKFTAGNSWEREQNIREAEQVALEIWRLGAAAICPHTNTRHFDGILPAQVFYDGDIAILRKCDAVFMVPGWENSIGAQDEHAVAYALGIPVFDNYRRLEDWLKDNK